MSRAKGSADVFIMHDGTTEGFGDAVNVAGYATLTISVTSLRGTAKMFGSTDGVNYTPIQALNLSTGTVTTTADDNATCVLATSGLQSIRISARKGTVIFARRAQMPHPPITSALPLKSDVESPPTLELILEELRKQSLQLSLITGGSLD